MVGAGRVLVGHRLRGIDSLAVGPQHVWLAGEIDRRRLCAGATTCICVLGVGCQVLYRRDSGRTSVNVQQTEEQELILPRYASSSPL
jgi:hypothetical protein